MCEYVKILWMSAVLQTYWHDTSIDILQNVEYLVLIKRISLLLPFFLFSFYLFCPYLPSFCSPLPLTSSKSWPAQLCEQNLKGLQLRSQDSWWPWKKKKKMGGGRRGVLQIKRHDESGQRVCHWCVSSLVARFEGGSKTEALTRLWNEKVTPDLLIYMINVRNCICEEG